MPTVYYNMIHYTLIQYINSICDLKFKKKKNSAFRRENIEKFLLDNFLK